MFLILKDNNLIFQINVKIFSDDQWSPLQILRYVLIKRQNCDKLGGKKMENETEQKMTRKSIRLKEYDYAQNGYYFITICTKNRKCILSTIENYNERRDLVGATIGRPCSSVICSKLTLIGKTVEKYIKKMKIIYKNIDIDEYIIMPNHIHIILIINEKQKVTISQMIQQLKGIISKELKESIWQKLFYEHIIRCEKEYLQIKQYIQNNPYNWEDDIYN